MASRAERTLERMERIWDGVAQADGDPAMMQDFRLGTLAIAEMSGARAFEDPRITFLLARVLAEAEPTREAEVSALLSRARRNTPPHEAWLLAEIDATWAQSTRSDPRLGIARASRALRQHADASRCGALYRKRSDAKLALGDLKGAAEDARRAVAQAHTALERASAHALLAVALDRAGDWDRALFEIRLARWSAPETELPELWDVFVFRPEDLQYARALSLQSDALSASSDDAAHAAYTQALEVWDRYLEASNGDDPFRGRARSHQRACESALSKLRATSAESP